MKTTTFLLATCTSPLTTSSADHHHSRTPTRLPFLVSKKPIDDAKQSALNIRGGDLGPISSKALAQTFGILAVGDALAGTISPIVAWENFGITIEPDSKGEHYLGHGLGSSASSLATTSLLALTSSVSVEEAIGYGFIARCAYMTVFLASRRYEDLGVPTIPHVIIYVVLLGTAVGILSGNSEDFIPLAKVVSILLAGHGALLSFNPRVDDGDDMTKKMAKVDGGYMFISSLFSALLSFGVEPVTAMGYIAIACMPMILGVLDLVEVDVLFGMSPRAWTVVMIAFIGAFAFGMLS